MRKSSLKNNKYIIIATIIIIILWEIVSVVVNNQIIMPGIKNILFECEKILVNGDCVSLIYYSLIRCFISFLISIILAVLLGVLSYINKWIYNFIYPILAVIKSVPTMAFIVLVLVWVSKETAPILIGIIISLPIFYDVTINTLINTDVKLIEMCRVYKVKEIDILKKIYLPSITISISNILSSTISLIFKVVIAGEVYAQPKYGIGAAIQLEKMQLNTSAVITWIIIIAIVSIIVDKILSVLLKKFNKWKGEDHYIN
ncbi:ABC transporter permease [Clostridium gasigenes]|uniref:ABC transporter permease subunit n=1 Tax=Clostridium gasigenes TaxID=94869 RepID=A0A1H0W8J8_9CLOT|nr:ABC transporter permease subunit [Clostridium gasigenes]MBB6625677.1 ABC transporter permease subunit [Clostridium gasigenes]MBB6716891.1 ABC transporter permease subunit [Clostridium gasigenes]MBU3134622.1 ABC transporter permease subunit [Clostridium gasigenes]SDP86705.1 NitT/TauT family transport system permease protein [Clostridium gasigenes]